MNKKHSKIWNNNGTSYLQIPITHDYFTRMLDQISLQWLQVIAKHEERFHFNEAYKILQKRRPKWITKEMKKYYKERIE
jgi:hypothetical protein